MERKSESIAALAKALVATQGQLKAVTRTSEGYNYKFADLTACWNSVRQPMTDSGLALVQTTRLTERGENVLETTLIHTSGEWISGEMLITPIKNDPQSLGSSLSYARRYGMMAILGVSADDDDGAAASVPNKMKGATKKPRSQSNAALQHEPNEKMRDHFKSLFRECVDEGISTKELTTIADDAKDEDIMAAGHKNRALLDAVLKHPELE